MELIIDVFSTNSESIDRTVQDIDDIKIVRTCKYCGKKFVARSKRACVCGRHHYSFCKICGAEFSQDKAISIGNKLTEVCNNRECKNKLSGMKSKCAIQKKYGVDNAFQAEEIKAKIRQTNLGKYGVEYAILSDVVKKNLSDSIKSFSEEKKQDIIDRTKQTCLEKYGVDSPLKSPQIRERSKQTCLEKYGVEYASQSTDFRQSVNDTWANKTEEQLQAITDRRKQTCLSKYGVDVACRDPEVRQRLIDSLVNKSDEEKQDIRERTIQTCLDKYGATSPAGSEEVQQKMRQSTFERFGVDYIFNLPEFREYLRLWTLENYGVENPLQSKELRDKGKQTSLARYGTEYPMQNEDMRRRMSQTRIHNYAMTIEDEECRNNYLEFMADPIEYVTTHFDHKPTYTEVEQSIGGRCSCTIYGKVPTSLQLCVQRSSSMEYEVEVFLKSLMPDMIVCKHNHTIIKPLELDLYLPDYNIAIECNPTYTHNSSVPCYSNEKPTPIDYHKNKTDGCEKAGVFLFHIFGYEWNHRRDVISSMLRNLVGCNNERLYARNLRIVDLDSLECKSFLDKNHRQRGVFSKVRLGLETSDGELVSVMTFSRIRSTIGRSKSEHDWELVRFCNKLNTSVVGGASKLFQHFLRHYRYDRIISFSDRAHTQGNLYLRLGFSAVEKSDPGYVWVHAYTDVYHNRVSCQKHNLRNLLNEPDLDIDNQTEKQIMMCHNFVQVYDSGTIRWEYTDHTIDR